MRLCGRPIRLRGARLHSQQQQTETCLPATKPAVRVAPDNTTLCIIRVSSTRSSAPPFMHMYYICLPSRVSVSIACLLCKAYAGGCRRTRRSIKPCSLAKDTPKRCTQFALCTQFHHHHCQRHQQHHHHSDESSFRAQKSRANRTRIDIPSQVLMVSQHFSHSNTPVKKSSDCIYLDKQLDESSTRFFGFHFKQQRFLRPKMIMQNRKHTTF